jgi:hypothetical protein
MRKEMQTVLRARITCLLIPFHWIHLRHYRPRYLVTARMGLRL